MSLFLEFEMLADLILYHRRIPNRTFANYNSSNENLQLLKFVIHLEGSFICFISVITWSLEQLT